MEEKHEIVRMETMNPVSEDSGESLIQPSQSEIVMKVSDLESKPSCRICYSGNSKERLLRPCRCKGTIEYVHRNCLERWLESKNFETCELCQHRFETKRTRKGCLDWIRQPEMQTERRNFIGDFTCFAFLTPLGVATFWLCAEGAIYYQKVKSSTLETAALVTLALFLLVAYFTWIILCTRYHIGVWLRWRNQNWNIRIVERVPSEENNGRSDTVISIPSDSSGDPIRPEEQLIRHGASANALDMSDRAHHGDIHLALTTNHNDVKIV